jgi:hypothetical protein
MKMERKYKQPKSLELLSIEKSAEWLCNIGEKLIDECSLSQPNDEILLSANKSILQGLEVVIENAHGLFEKDVVHRTYTGILQDPAG